MFALYRYIKVHDSDVITFDQFKECISLGARSDQVDTQSVFNLETVIEKFQNVTKKQICDFLVTILLKLREPKKGIIYEHFDIAIKSYARCLQNNELFLIYRAMDKQRDGLVGYDDIKNFFDKYKDKDSDYLFYIILLAKYL